MTGDSWHLANLLEVSLIATQSTRDAWIRNRLCERYVGIRWALFTIMTAVQRWCEVWCDCDKTCQSPSDVIILSYFIYWRRFRTLLTFQLFDVITNKLTTANNKLPRSWHHSESANTALKLNHQGQHGSGSGVFRTGLGRLHDLTDETFFAM